MRGYGRPLPEAMQIEAECFNRRDAWPREELMP